MSNILLTQYQGMFIGPIAKILGYLMEGIFYVLDMVGIHNSGLSIILFTVAIYLYDAAYNQTAEVFQASV